MCDPRSSPVRRTENRLFPKIAAGVIGDRAERSNVMLA